MLCNNSILLYFMFDVSQRHRFLSETYGVQDCIFYDASSSSNLSKYSVPSGASMTYDSTNTCYLLSNSAQGVKTIDLSNVTTSNTVKISYDVKLLTSSNNIQSRLGLFNGSNGVTCRQIISIDGTFLGLQTQAKTTDGTSIGLQTNIGISKDTWYNVEVTFNNGSVTATIKQGDTTISTVTASESILASTGNTFGLCAGLNANSQFNVKNIKIKPL